MANKKGLLMDATMKVIAENGFANFSMKMVTNYANVGETLVYKHFETKENLLHECFLQYHRGLAEIIEKSGDNYFVPELDIKEKELRFKDTWYTFFDYLVQGDYKTIFYFDYRDSIAIKNIYEQRLEFFNKHFLGLVKCLGLFEDGSSIEHSEKNRIFLSYIMDVSGIMARRVIRDEICDSAENREIIWNMIWSGVRAYLE